MIEVLRALVAILLGVGCVAAIGLCIAGIYVIGVAVIEVGQVWRNSRRDWWR